MVDDVARHAPQPLAGETAHLPPSAPPRNHGRTVAAWTTTVVVLAGAVVAAAGLVFSASWLFWVGAAVAVAGPVVGKVLQVLGYGQGGAATRARESGRTP